MNTDKYGFDFLGLNATEKAILGSLSVAKNVQDIAKHTGISRTGINYCLSNLIKRDLVISIWNGKRKSYMALSPKQLASKFQGASDEILLDKGDKKGARVRLSKENEFIIHVGPKEIIPAYERIASANKNERIKAIQHHRSWSELMKRISSSQLIEFNRSIVRNHLIVDGMLNESAYKSYWEEIQSDRRKHKAAVESLEGRMADYTVFPDNYFDYNAEIWLFKSTSLIINWHEDVAIEITNAQMTGFLKDMFEFVKMGGRKIDHNQVMRDLMGKVKDKE